MKTIITTVFATLSAVCSYSQTYTAPNGDVGIGTTTPTEKLDIHGKTVVRNTLFTVGPVHGFTPYYGASFYIDNNGGPSYFNLSGGSVGIGTAAPQSRLHIKQLSEGFNGGLKLERSENGVTWSTVVGGDNKLYFGNASAPGNDFSTAFSIDIAGNAISTGHVSAMTGSDGGFQSSTYSAGHNNIWRFGNATEYGIAYYQGTGYPWGRDAIGFHFGDRNSPKFYIQDNGSATFTGVLTGKSALFTDALSVNKPGSPKGLNLAEFDTYANMRVISNAETSGVNADGMWIGYNNGNSGVTRLFGGGSTSQSIILNGTTVSLLHPLSGTTATLSGNIETSNGLGNYVRLGGTGTSASYLKAFETHFTVGNVYSGGSLGLVAGNAEQVTIAPNGSATFTGQVSAMTGSDGGFQSSTYSAGHNNIWRFGNATEYGIAYYQGTGYPWGTDAIGFHLGDRNSPKFFVQNNGNATLAGSLTGQSATFSGDATSNSVNLTCVGGGIINNQTANLFLQKPIGAGFIFRDGAPGYAEHMRLDQNGNLCIGTTNPQGYKLAVAGNVIAESVKVALQGNWPDYVFKPGNKLLSLQEVESYVQQNNHLPEMPSEEEVRKEGIDLGQMDAKLLKKIEELTLYMIDFKKEVDVLKQKNQTLEKEVAQLKAR